MISLMKVGQLCGHSCFKMDTRTRFNLFRKVRWLLRLSSVLEVSMMKLTTKFRMPSKSISHIQLQASLVADLDIVLSAKSSILS